MSAMNSSSDSTSNEDELIIQVLHFATSVDAKKSRLNQLKRKRRALLINLFAILNKRNALYLSIMKQKIPKKLWVVERHGTFWEEDVPRNDAVFFKDSFRMNRSSFEILCQKLKGMARKNTSFRNCIALDKRVAIALYTLRSSAEYSTIGRLFGVSKASVSQILTEFCIKVWELLGPEYLSERIFTQEKIDECTEGFEKIGFPQCFGALDGCHIEVRPSAKDAVDYYNNKGWYSIVLLALVDYRYRFLYIDVGAPGRCNDSQIFEQSTLIKNLETPLFKQNAKLINEVNVPVIILGDSAFPFTDSLMKPFPFCTTAEEKEKVFNYRLSKTRRVVENAFEHLKARFGRVGKGIDNNIKNAASIIKCCCVLHNFVNERSDKINEMCIQDHQHYENQIQRFQPEFADNFTDKNPKAEEIRNAIAVYFGSQHEESSLMS